MSVTPVPDEPGRTRGLPALKRGRWATVRATLTGLACVGLATPIAFQPHAKVAGPGAGPPPYVPASGAYLGIVPNFNLNATFEQQALAFERKMSRQLGLVAIYLNWGQVPPMRSLDPLEDKGALPLINMNCGPSDSSIAAGLHDHELVILANALRSYGAPVLFRWFWEMNLPNANGHAACLGTTNQGATYIAAFQHIWTVFRQVGASNVSFVWCPSDSANAAHKTDLYFYPGNRYVDWIGADIYDRPTITSTFAQQFGPFYSYWAGVAPKKPFVIAETGAVGSPAQVLWLHQIESALTVKLPGSSATPFSHIHAVSYVNAIALANYILKDGTPGFDQFSKMAHSRYFSVYVKPEV